MADTDIFLQLEQQLKRTPTPRRRGGRGPSRPTTPRKAPAQEVSPVAPTPVHSPAAQSGALQTRPAQDQTQTEAKQPRPDEGRHDVTPDVTADGMTSLLHGVNTKLWRAMIEETETHNSSLRLSQKEREQVEDLVRDLKRTHRIKSSMNELARLGLLFLIYEFKQRGPQSIIARVKTA